MLHLCSASTLGDPSVPCRRPNIHARATPHGCLLWLGVLMAPSLHQVVSGEGKVLEPHMLVQNCPFRINWGCWFASVLQVTMMVAFACGSRLRGRYSDTARHAQGLAVSMPPVWRTQLVNSTLVQGHRQYITSIAWEPAHIEFPPRRFCSGSKDATIKVWDVPTR